VGFSGISFSLVSIPQWRSADSASVRPARATALRLPNAVDATKGRYDNDRADARQQEQQSEP
jgi:hypothetical protein